MMENDGDDAPHDAMSPDAEAREFETDAVLGGGPGAGNRAGGLAFLALAAVVAAGVYYHFSASGGDAFKARLDSEMLTHAELTLASREAGNRVEVVPTWPLHLYDTLRRDIALYAAAAALAAFLWGLSARARARRDAYLVHVRLEAELAEVRRRLDMMESAWENAPGRSGGGTKG